MQYYIGRCLGPCVEGLTTPERYAEAVHDVKMFLEGRGADLSRSLQQRMAAAAEREQYELAAKYRDLISTVDLLEQKQRIAAVEGDDADVFGYHYENEMLAVNLFHMRGGKIVDKREFFWEDLERDELGRRVRRLRAGRIFFGAAEAGVSRSAICAAHDLRAGGFRRSPTLEEVLSEGQKRRVQIHVPQRGEKRSLVDLVGQNAKQAYDQRFRVMKPAAKAIQEALQDALMLPELPKRIECFDISHIQGAETVASMVVWEDGKMKKSDYRKFIIKGVNGVDDFASMREVVTRRYKRVQERQAEDAEPGAHRRRHRATARRRRRRWRRWASSTSRWPPSPSAKKSSMYRARRMSRSCSTGILRCCTWCSWCATKPTALQ